MARRRIEAHADDLDLVFLLLRHPVAEAAGFLRATGGVVFGIEIEQHHLFADNVRQLPGLAILVLPLDERRRVGVDAKPEVGAQHRGSAGADSVRHGRIAGFDAADRGSVDADGSGDGSLTDAGPKTDHAELLPEAGTRSSELPVAFVDRCPAGRGMGCGCRIAPWGHRRFASERRRVLPAVQQMALNGVLPGP